MDEKKQRHVVTRILIYGGLALILIGALIAVGVRIYIWGTNRIASESQEDLFRQWEEEPADLSTPPLPGEPALHIVIPSIEVDSIVVELSALNDLDNLSRGPGHIPGTAYPGGDGNVVISGHRTTYGAPFNRIDELAPGDEIYLYTSSGKFTYYVSEQFTVDPTDLGVLDQEGPARLTLTSCHPEFSARQRIVVVSLLAGAEGLAAIDPPR